MGNGVVAPAHRRMLAPRPARRPPRVGSVAARCEPGARDRRRARRPLSVTSHRDTCTGLPWVYTFRSRGCTADSADREVGSGGVVMAEYEKPDVEDFGSLT